MRLGASIVSEYSVPYIIKIGSCELFTIKVVTFV